MTDDRHFSDEAMADEDFEEAEALTEGPVDPSVIESVVGEVDDEDGAVLLPSSTSRGDYLRDDVDGTDMEAVFDSENRDMDLLEQEYEASHDGEVPDLVDLAEMQDGDGEA